MFRKRGWQFRGWAAGVVLVALLGPPACAAESEGPGGSAGTGDQLAHSGGTADGAGGMGPASGGSGVGMGGATGGSVNVGSGGLSASGGTAESSLGGTGGIGGVDASGGALIGGAPAGGAPAGGAPAGGAPAGGAPAGGAPAGGAPAGGAPAGGAPAGGTTGIGGDPGSGGTGAEANFHIYLLIGQSNMEGMPSPESQDRVTNDRVQVLAYDNCSNLGRTYNQWYTAAPPLHGCWAGLGPGDNFGKRMAEAYPEATIGLVPCGISGVDIDFFRKGVVSQRRDEFVIPPDDHWSGAYEWVIERALLAQQVGVIRGILFHQGEADNTDPAWPGKVAEMVSDLRADLGLSDSAPFLAGELLYTGCCSAHNTRISELPGLIPSAYVISAEGLGGMDEAHFDLAGQRELGNRYAATMLTALAAP